jgi:hypothetical protein
MTDSNETQAQDPLERARIQNEAETKQAMQLAAEARARDAALGILPPEQFIANAVKGKLEREEFKTRDGEPGEPVAE